MNTRSEAASIVGMHGDDDLEEALYPDAEAFGSFRRELSIFFSAPETVQEKPEGTAAASTPGRCRYAVNWGP